MTKSVFNFIPKDTSRLARIQIINNLEDDNNNCYGLINFYGNADYSEFFPEIRQYLKFVSPPNDNPRGLMLDDGNGLESSLTTKIHIKLRHESSEEIHVRHYHVLFTKPVTAKNLEEILHSLKKFESESTKHFYLSNDEIDQVLKQYGHYCAENNISRVQSPTLNIDPSILQAFWANVQEFSNTQKDSPLESSQALTKPNFSSETKSDTFGGFESGFFKQNKAQKPESKNKLETFGGFKPGFFNQKSATKNNPPSITDTKQAHLS